MIKKEYFSGCPAISQSLIRMEHPFLEDEFKIRWSQLKPENVVPDISEAIKRAEDKISALSGDNFPETGLTIENT